jgi:DNA-binding PadR family transcriptional regulator
MRFPVLALLSRGPAHGYELKHDLETQFGSVWGEINIGQVYATLSRLERDGLVLAQEVEQDARPNKKVYSLTGSGKELLLTWLEEPDELPRLRDHFIIKVALAAAGGLADPIELINRQRMAYLQALRDLQALAGRLGEGAAPGELLVVEGAALHLEADLKWLDAADNYFTTGELR